jgi:hypothetical protein
MRKLNSIKLTAWLVALALLLVAPAAFAQRDAPRGEPSRAKAANLDLVILVDDALQSSVSLQLADVRDFVRELPVTTRVAVVYNAHGVAVMQQEFTTDHELAAAALRMPHGSVDDASGLFDSLLDLHKRWPATGNRRSVLLISSGLDLLRGASDSQAGLNPDLRRAIDTYRREGIVVYTIFASNAAPIGRNSFLVLNGQSCLTRLAAETGGESYFQGSQTPVSFRPFLSAIRVLLSEQEPLNSTR